MKRILIAGIGNVFHGDDGFGCEIARQLEKCALPPGVTVVDFGTRTHDLAHALHDPYDIVILVDAAPCGKDPGTLYLIEPDTHQLEECECADADALSMNPIAAIQMAQALGGVHAKIYVVGCEPAVLANDMDEIGLSLKVQEVLPQALAMIESLLVNLVMEDDEDPASFIPV